ncbi:hypothetical protein [Pseudomonas pharyngis]|uniref:hypothetical protein n=1 Tax=Pseudomonas pharyngis TaxID=2892333 RepID=UPI001F2BB414|nr:hypothetical protein [Pseudomonas pharyngis]
MQKDNEFLSLYLENETSKIRTELLKENQSIRLELEALTNSSKSLLADVENKITNAENKITEKAIDKTLFIIKQVKEWVGIAAVFISAIFLLGGFLGYNNLVNTLTDAFKDRVTKWMQFDEQGSGGKRALDELRTEAIINAYMIRLARNYSSSSESLFPINGAEEKRLLDVLQTPTTKYSDFSDILTIIVKNRGPFRFALSEDDVGKKIASLLTVEEISPEKKRLILEKMNGDAALLPYSKSILNDENQSIYVRLAAFENVKNFDSELAIAFANKNVDNITPRLKPNLVLYLARESGQYDPALRYVQVLIEQKSEYWQSNLLELVSGLGETLPSAVNSDAYKLADLFTKVVEIDGKIGMSDEKFGPKRIVLKLDGGYAMLAKPGRLLKEPELIKNIITKKGDSIDWLTKSTDFFQLSDQGNLLTTMIVTLGENSSIETQGNFKLTVTNVLGDIWLRTQNLPGGKQLVATWRDSNTGIIHTESVRSASQLVVMNFRLSFDEKLFESLTYDYRSPTDFL